MSKPTDFPSPKKNSQINLNWPTIIISLIIGTLAGALAIGIAGVSLLSDFYSPIDDHSFWGSLIAKRQQQEKLVKMFNYQVSDSLTESIVGIYRKKTTGANVANQIYLPGDWQGQGMILTSDGWILTTKQVIDKMPAEQLVVSFNQEIFVVEKILIDEISRVAFLKVEVEEKNWPVAQLVDDFELDSGQAVIVLKSTHEIITSNIKNPCYNLVGGKTIDSLIGSSDSFNRVVSLKDKLPADYQGALVLNLNGKIIGLINDTETNSSIFTPSYQINSIILSVLQTEQIKRPSLGVYYLDLSEVIGLQEINSTTIKQLHRGALIYNKPGLASIIPNSSADQADLQAGDIIIKINKDIINNKVNLTQLIQEYTPGEQVKIIFLRDGVDMEVEVTLGELEISF